MHLKQLIKDKSKDIIKIFEISNNIIIIHEISKRKKLQTIYDYSNYFKSGQRFPSIFRNKVALRIVTLYVHDNWYIGVIVTPSTLIYFYSSN